MKHILLLMTVLGVLIAPVHADAAESFRANYEISIAQDGIARSIRTTSELSSGVALEQQLDPYRIQLLAGVEALGAYSLTVSVLRLPESPQAVPLPVSHTLHGTVGAPMEFNFTLGAFAVSGAIILTLRRS